VRAFQQLGYDETTLAIYDLAIYDEALRRGDLLLHVPARPQDSDRTAALLQRHGVHDVGYLGPGTFEQFPLPQYGLTPIRPSAAGRCGRPVRQDLVPCPPNARQEVTPAIYGQSRRNWRCY
jgi:hypothetical protein